LDLDIAELRLAQAQARNFGSAIELARAEIARAERALADANAGLTSARNIEADRDMIPGFERMVLDAQAALARARAEYERLLQEQTAHKFDISILAKEVERARLALARVQSSIDPNLERAVEVSRLTLERLEAQLGRAQIVAPFDGRVSSHSLTVGKTVRAFDPVIIISKPGGLEAAAELSQSRLVEIAVGQPVSVTLNSVPGKVYSGVVRRLPQAGAATTACPRAATAARGASRPGPRARRAKRCGSSAAGAPVRAPAETTIDAAIAAQRTMLALRATAFLLVRAPPARGLTRRPARSARAPIPGGGLIWS